MYLAHARTSPPNDRSDHSCRGHAASRENTLYSFNFVLCAIFVEVLTSGITRRNHRCVV